VNKKMMILPVLLVFFLSACAPNQPDSGRTSSEIEVSDQQAPNGPTATPGSMSSEGMGGHMMEPIGGANVEPAAESKGGQPLPFQDDNGVKVFELTTKTVQWSLTDGASVTAMTYNGTVPGPEIRVTEGERVRVIVKNALEEPTTVHFHGVELPNAMDGVPGVTQEAIRPGESFTYEFEARPVGTFWYHSHFESDVQVSAGLYAPFVIEPRDNANKPDLDITLMLGEWLIRDGKTYAPMPMAGMEPNYFSINGKVFPSTETITVKKGQRVRLRLVGTGQFAHPMHLHGMPFEIVATDGHPVPEAAQLTKDTVNVAPGERYDIEFIANETGQWMLHCHILHHVTNDNVEPGGLMLIVNVVE